jgi:dienelactone hydrolase
MDMRFSANRQFLFGILILYQSFGFMVGVFGQSTLEPEVIKVPLNGVDIVTLVYRPTNTGPFPVVVFSHGRDSEPVDRARPQIPPEEHVSYWLRKGFVFVAPVRIGYGQTGGPDLEDSGIRWKNGVCVNIPDFDKVATNAARSVTTVLDWLRRRVWIDNQRIILEGQSAGGFATVKLGSLNLPGVIGYINFAGGTGGNPKDSPGRSGHPELLERLYEELGYQTKVPSIWFYAQNDQYWGPNMPGVWYEAFSQGGSPAQFVHTPPLKGQDGHLLLYFGEKMWEKPLDEFVRSLGFRDCYENCLCGSISFRHFYLVAQRFKTFR